MNEQLKKIKQLVEKNHQIVAIGEIGWSTLKSFFLKCLAKASPKQ
jgi:predicted metal-dependent TIM-barrel fold hydrolase